MSYATVEDRVDRLEALFGQFLTGMALLSKHAGLAGLSFGGVMEVSPGPGIRA